MCHFEHILNLNTVIRHVFLYKLRGLNYMIIQENSFVWTDSPSGHMYRVYSKACAI